MKEGGLGGANTISGLHFEGRVDLIHSFKNLKGYRIEEKGEAEKWYELYFNNSLVAEIYKKHSLYKVFLKKHKID